MALLHELKSSQEGDFSKECSSGGSGEGEDSEFDGFMSDNSDEDPTFDVARENPSRVSKTWIRRSKPRVSEDAESADEEEADLMEVAVPELSENDQKCFERVESLIKDFLNECSRGGSGEGEDSKFDGFMSDNSDEDPTSDVVRENQSRVSKTSIRRSKPHGMDFLRGSKDAESADEEAADLMEVAVSELSENDEKCFERVESLIKDGQLDKLKVDQCKVYLRKYGLRLTGKKDVLMERIKEHLEIVNGGGEKKYPSSSFVLNCKGDACTGDMVMFEQNVYEMFSIVSRSATAPPCGTRIIAGRIVKESYGAAKQQHTFTIEVLWSKGEKPLPALHPLLIKGRNLYRLKTLRQRWASEEERWKVLQEKHSRGSLARCSRETRILEKELNKGARVKRMIEKKSDQFLPDNRNRHQVNQQETNCAYQQQRQRHHQENQHHLILLQRDAPVSQQSTQQVLQKNLNPTQRDVQQHMQHQLQCLSIMQQSHANLKLHQYQQPFASANLGFHQRQPLSILNSLSSVPQRQHGMKRQPCRFYREGRCRFNDNCKYLHDSR